MITYWSSGLRREAGFKLGQVEALISVGLSLLSTGAKIGLSWYQGKRAADEAKKAQEAMAANQAAVQASKDAEQKAQQKAVAAQQAAAAPIEGTSLKIIGLSPTTFYAGAGILGVGAIATTLILAGRK